MEEVQNKKTKVKKYETQRNNNTSLIQEKECGMD